MGEQTKKSGNGDALRRDAGHASRDERSIEMLIRYAGDPSGGSLSSDELAEVTGLLDSDPYWLKVFEELKSDYTKMEEALNRSEIGLIPAPVSRKGFREALEEKLRPFLENRTVRYALAGAAALVVIFASASIASRIVTPASVALARIGDESLALRGGQAFPLEAVDAIQSGRYEEAIDRLRALTMARSDSESTAINNYLLGIALLHSSERSILGFFPRYDRETVIEAMRRLQISVRSIRPTPGGSDFEDACRFALGKAALMLDDRPKAESYFLKVNERNNPYRMPARMILSSLAR